MNPFQTVSFKRIFTRDRQYEPLRIRLSGLLFDGEIVKVFGAEILREQLPNASQPFLG